MIRVKKIAHATYEMSDVEQQTEYYTEILGLTLTESDKGIMPSDEMLK
jgi:catechol-2,3-dioxygenase